MRIQCGDCVAALEIIVLSAVYCIPVLVALSASTSYNTKQERADARVTKFSGFDNLSMGNVEVGFLDLFPFSLSVSALWDFLSETYAACWDSWRSPEVGRYGGFLLGCSGFRS
jgi:hypothetical protein